MSRYFITTPIYYVNDKPHIGHAYTSVAADVLARFKRLCGDKVAFLTGTDEHGQKVERSAQKAGVPTQQFVDAFADNFCTLHAQLNCSNTDFIRTSQPRHKDYVAKIWQNLEDNGFIYLAKYCGWYSMRDEAFYDEAELVDGKAPTGAEVEWLEEDSYFFKLSAFTDRLLAFYEANPEFISPTSRRNEVVSFVRAGLNDLSVSRTSFSWGIPVPSNPSHVIYVWLDALFNYVSANEANWPADVHVVGKDILRFHAVFWPAFLMALDMPLPKKIFAHGWWTNEGQKISKSLGNTLDPVQLIAESSVDYFRYYIMREFPFGNDGNYSQHSFKQRINAELANNIGNLIQRTVSLNNKRREAVVPPLPQHFEEADERLLNDSLALVNNFHEHFEKIEIQEGLEAIVNLGRRANEYINEKAPWADKDAEKFSATVFVLSNVFIKLGGMLQIIMPTSAQAIMAIFGVKSLSIKDLEQRYFLLGGETIITPQIIFPRLETTTTV